MFFIYSDLAKILQNPLPGICVVPNEDDITKVINLFHIDTVYTVLLQLCQTV